MDIITALIILIAIIAAYKLLETYIKTNGKKKDKDKEESVSVSPSDLAPEVQQYPYKKKMLLTKSEYAFYNKLKENCDKNNLIICPKVRMEDFLQVTDTKNTLKYRGYIKARHIDFMICDSKLHIMAGVELDDSTHTKPDVQKRDEFKNEVFKAIQLPLYRIKVSHDTYDEQIENTLKDLGIIKTDTSTTL